MKAKGREPVASSRFSARWKNTLPIWFQGAPRLFNHSAGVMPRARISFAIAFRKSSNHPAMMSGVAYSAPGTGGNCSARKAFSVAEASRWSRTASTSSGLSAAACAMRVSAWRAMFLIKKAPGSGTVSQLDTARAYSPFPVPSSNRRSKGGVFVTKAPEGRMRKPLIFRFSSGTA